jgi:protein arginine kinase activator
VAKTPLGSFLAAMGKGLPETEPVARAGESCARCGASLQDFRESGRLGCAECYRSFEVPLRDLLRRLHGSTHHVGERYAEHDGEAVEVRETTAELREQLRLAVETENFELAAELRDRLRVLE